MKIYVLLVLIFLCFQVEAAMKTCEVNIGKSMDSLFDDDYFPIPEERVNVRSNISDLIPDDRPNIPGTLDKDKFLDPSSKLQAKSVVQWKYSGGDGGSSQHNIGQRSTLGGVKEPYLQVRNAKVVKLLEEGQSVNPVLYVEVGEHKYVFKPHSKDIINDAFTISDIKAQNFREKLVSDLREKMGTSANHIEGMSGALDKMEGYFVKYEEGMNLAKFESSDNKIIQDLYDMHKQKIEKFRSNEMVSDFLFADSDRVLRKNNYFVILKRENGKLEFSEIKSIDAGASFPKVAAVEKKVVKMGDKNAEIWESYEDYIHRLTNTKKSQLGSNAVTGDVSFSELKTDLGSGSINHYFQDIKRNLPNKLPDNQGIDKLKEYSEKEWVEYLKNYQIPGKTNEVVKLTDADIQGFLYRRKYILDKYHQQLLPSSVEAKSLSSDGFDWESFVKDIEESI